MSHLFFFLIYKHVFQLCEFPNFQNIPKLLFVKHQCFVVYLLFKNNIISISLSVNLRSFFSKDITLEFKSNLYSLI